MLQDPVATDGSKASTAALNRVSECNQQLKLEDHLSGKQGLKQELSETPDPAPQSYTNSKVHELRYQRALEHKNPITGCGDTATLSDR